ncbi:hypothetical protein DSO57_1036717 [Entomophthora muscae]|uniref:Uncharacterized protein n=1 Tax=Entomophthora muscae TaxID=34485 RepID=A0ACC2S1B3_9FUNG|nr:hypothetical protein DSO57_1036717 [Entomophthora muscae]
MRSVQLLPLFIVKIALVLLAQGTESEDLEFKPVEVFELHDRTTYESVSTKFKAEFLFAETKNLTTLIAPIGQCYCGLFTANHALVFSSKVEVELFELQHCRKSKAVAKSGLTNYSTPITFRSARFSFNKVFKPVCPI